jgi:hypothetical protein
LVCDPVLGNIRNGILGVDYEINPELKDYRDLRRKKRWCDLLFWGILLHFWLKWPKILFLLQGG